MFKFLPNGVISRDRKRWRQPVEVRLDGDLRWIRVNRQDERGLGFGSTLGEGWGPADEPGRDPGTTPWRGTAQLGGHRPRFSRWLHPTLQDRPLQAGYAAREQELIGLILGLCPANERRRFFCNDVSHWLGASLESALKTNSEMSENHWQSRVVIMSTWWYRQLSLWQPPVPPVTKTLASWWRLSVFSERNVLSVLKELCINTQHLVEMC